MSYNQTNSFKLYLEFLGTFILVAGINLSCKYNEDGTQEGNPILFFFTIFSAITVSRTISGANLNPAVTISYYFNKPSEVRSKEQPLVTLYILTQVLAALSACFFSYIFYRENVYKLQVAPGTLPLHALIIEIFASFVLVYMFLCQGNYYFNFNLADSNAKLVSCSAISTLLYSIAVLTAANLSGNISGGCLNPAFGFAQNFVRLIITGDVSECKYLWIYIVGPILGGLLATYVNTNFFKTFFYHKNKIITHSI